MPPMPHVDDSTITAIYAFLNAPAGGGGQRGGPNNNATPTTPEGPVVASGGAPQPPGAQHRGVVPVESE